MTTNQNQMVTSYGLIFISRFENFFNNIFNFRRNRQKFRGGRKPTLENNFEKKGKKGMILRTSGRWPCDQVQTLLKLRILPPSSPIALTVQ